MRILFASGSLTLQAGQAVSGIARRPHTVKIVNGRAWVTVQDFSHDYWLSAGDTLPVPPGRLVVVEAADGASRVDTQLPARQSLLPVLYRRINQAMQRLAASRVTGAAPRRPPATRGIC
jgi:Protein of unknown function (DUF2917)